MRDRVSTKLRVCVQILFFDCSQLILRAIENTAPHVDRIYIIYSKKPWSKYNKTARTSYENPSDLKILKTSSYFYKITVIDGEWDSEEDQRNTCLDIARNEGYDLLIVQDADEFYAAEEFKRNLEAIEDNPNYDAYRNPWYVFFKTIEYVVVNRYPLHYDNSLHVDAYKNTLIGFSACFAINLRSKARFGDKRLPNTSNTYMLPGLCLHLSYVLSDEQMLRKLNTWGHSCYVDIDSWFRVKWLGWQSTTKNFHPISLLEWAHVDRFSGALPKEIIGFEPGEQKYRPASHSERTLFRLKEIRSWCNFALRDIRFIIRRVTQRMGGAK